MPQGAHAAGTVRLLRSRLGPIAVQGVRPSGAPVMPDGQTTCRSAAVLCDCRKVLDALAQCRSVFETLSDQERLAVLCTLASEQGLSVSGKAPAPDGPASRFHGPDGLEWAREFVSQVVLSDALVGAALRLDESKREIDDVAKRLELVAAESPAPRPGTALYGRQERLEVLEQLVRDYRTALTPPLEGLCKHAQQLLDRAQAGSIDAEIALAISEEAACLAEISIRFTQPVTQA